RRSCSRRRCSRSGGGSGRSSGRPGQLVLELDEGHSPRDRVVLPPQQQFVKVHMILWILRQKGNACTATTAAPPLSGRPPTPHARRQRAQRTWFLANDLLHLVPLVPTVRSTRHHQHAVADVADVVVVVHHQLDPPLQPHLVRRVPHPVIRHHLRRIRRPVSSPTGIHPLPTTTAPPATYVHCLGR